MQANTLQLNPPVIVRDIKGFGFWSLFWLDFCVELCSWCLDCCQAKSAYISNPWAGDLLVVCTVDIWVYYCGFEVSLVEWLKHLEVKFTYGILIVINCSKFITTDQEKRRNNRSLIAALSFLLCYLVPHSLFVLYGLGNAEKFLGSYLKLGWFSGEAW